MSAPSSVALPAHLRRRGEIIGLFCGLLCFPFALFGATWGAFLPAGPAGVVLPMVFAAAAAGVIGCLLGFTDTDELAPVFAPRIGVRAGAIAALSGGAVTVFAATLHAFGVGTPASAGGWMDFLTIIQPRSRPWQVLIVAILGVPPSIFFGTAAALLTAMSRAPRDSQVTGGSKATVPASRPLFIALLVFCIAGYLSPFLVSLRPRPKSIAIVRATPTPAAPAPRPPPPPKWRYEKPADFDSAPPSRVVVGEQRSLGEIVSNWPVALSPDERLLASFQRGSGTKLQIHNLETLDVEVRRDFPLSPEALAWSPDGKKLLIVAEDSSRHLLVLKLDSLELLTLPQPQDQQIPGGSMDWWDDREVVFRAPDRLAFLDLDGLLVHDGASSAKWKGLSKDDQEAFRRNSNPFHLPGNERWRMQVQPVLRRYAIQGKDSLEWLTEQSLKFVLSSPANAYRTVLRSPDIRVGNSVLATKDGTKVVHLHDGQGTILFLGVRSDPATWVKIKTSAPPTPALAEAVAKKNLCAFICPPIVNPLNGRTVGPNRNVIKGLARFQRWEGLEAELWIEEDHLPLQLGDVVADPHVWGNHRARAADQVATTQWFSVIDSRYSQAAPSRKEAPDLERIVVTAVMPNRGADQIDRIEPRYYQPPKPPTQLPPQDVLAGSNAAKIVTAANAAVIADFVRQHHAKSSRGDVAGLIQDYASQVDYFNNGVVDREFVRKDEAEYHSPGTLVSEILTNPPLVEQVNASVYSARYTISFHRTRPDGRWVKGFSDIELRIEITASGPQIVRQRGQARDQQKGP